MPRDLERDPVNDDTLGPADQDSPETTGGSSVSDITPTTPDGSVEPMGRYELREEIARGGMGAVYVAIDRTLGRQVAVKLLQSRFDAGSAVARRFVDEAHIAGQLQHPGIPPIHDLGTLPDGRPFLAMKLIKGQTLDDLLDERTDPGADRGRFIAVFEQVCQAVAYAHARRVIHRDLKPQNIMVGAFGEVQVMDWGLAKVLGETKTRRAPPIPTSESQPRSCRRAIRTAPRPSPAVCWGRLHTWPPSRPSARSNRSTSGATCSGWVGSWRWS
jgi:serine/threonine protein kinase